MLKNTILLLLPILLIIIITTSSVPNPRNPPTGNTGAPGETACMFSGCHGGGMFTGTVDITGVPDTVIANQTYSITLTNKSNAVRSGFQLTVLDAVNKFTGTLIKGTGVNIAKDNFNGKTYARQEFAVFLMNGEVSWNFQWQAPASVLNDSMIFYFTSMCADGDGTNAKDNSIRNKKRVIFQMPVANKDLHNKNSNIKMAFREGNLYFQDEQNRIVQHVFITSLQGHPLGKANMLASNIFKLPVLLPGIYLIQFKTGSSNHSKKLFIP